MLFFDFRRQCIDVAQQWSRVYAALFLLDAPAFIALAPSGPVVLRDREDGGLRMLLDPALDRLYSQPQHIGICQAKLAAFLAAFAVNQRKVFGMILEVL